MADVEKAGHKAAETPLPAIDIAIGQSADVGRSHTLLQRLEGRSTDPNELGRHLFEQSQQYDEAQLKCDAKKVCRKLDFMLLPLVSAVHRRRRVPADSHHRCAAHT